MLLDLLLSFREWLPKTMVLFRALRTYRREWDNRGRVNFSVPVRVWIRPFKAYFISNALNFNTTLKDTLILNSTPGLNFVLHTFFYYVSKEVAAFCARDISAIITTPLPAPMWPLTTGPTIFASVRRKNVFTAETWVVWRHLSSETDICDWRA